MLILSPLLSLLPVCFYFFLVSVQVLSSPKTVFSAESVVFSTSVFHLAGPKLGSHLFPFALPSPRNRVEAASLQEGQHQFLS